MQNRHNLKHHVTDNCLIRVKTFTWRQRENDGALIVSRVCFKLMPECIGFVMMTISCNMY